MAVCWPSVRATRLRVTRLNECCAPPEAGDPAAYVVTKGFITLDIQPIVNEGTDIEVTSADGSTCIYSPACPEHRGFDVSLTLCSVDAALLSMMTGTRVELDPAGEAVGFRQQEGSDHICDTRVAVEAWTGQLPADCGTDDLPEYGYVLLPCVGNFIQSGGITLEDGAATFELSGTTFFSAGNSWGAGPYNVVETDAAGTAGPLPTPIAADEHLLMRSTKVAPPELGACGAHPFPAALPFDGDAPAA